jgi:putative DNA primase/helicase
LGSRTYNIHGFQEWGGNLRASLTVRQGADVLVRDVLSLTSAKRRKEFAAKLNGDAEAVENDLIRIGDALRVELAARQQANEAEPPASGMDDPAPWPDYVEGDVLLREVLEAVRRFVVLPRYADVAAVLWVVAAHAHAAWDVFPILAATSPTKRCGKTTLLDVLRVLLPRPLLASNVSPAAIFRAIESWNPSLLVDEADTFLTGNDELRGVLNSSHARTAAFVLRVEGEGTERTVTAFSTWCPKVIALIGSLPATLEDRSIVLRLRRKTKADRVERARRRTLASLADLGQKAARWAEDNLEALAQAEPAVPEELDDRAADNWESLIAVADLMGGRWPELARKAALALSAGRDAGDDEVGIRLLRNIREVFTEKGTTRIPSDELVSALIADEALGWGSWRKGRPLDQRGLARILAPFGISPKKFREDKDKTSRGYEREHFEDTWGRYLVSDPEQAEQMNSDKDLGPIFEAEHGGPVPDEKSALTIQKQKIVPDVPDKNRIVAATHQEAELF